MRDLAARSDVPTENYKVGDLPAMACIRGRPTVNPQIIYCSVTGFARWTVRAAPRL